MDKITTVIFDLGGVLIDWNPQYLYRKIFEDEEKMHRFLNEIATSEWNEQQDAGRSLREATAILLEKHPAYEAEIQAYYGRWTEMLGGAIEGTVEILEDLHDQDRHRLYALTNWSAETWPHAVERFEFLQLFEGILVSGAEKVKKPDDRIYRLICDRYRIRPGEALFIDDSARNVAGAKAAGLAAIRFESPEQLRAELERRAILLPE